MSLFKARDWWRVSCGSEEGFDKGCLCVANIDNSKDGADKIIVGSHGGALRVYSPHPLRQEDGSLSGFRPDELLLESQLHFPILQVASGCFVSSSSQLHLAVLHPRKLSVYTISVINGAVDHGTHYYLSLTYEHNLQRSAYCMATGHFGGVKGKDFMCVQSLDGTLTFFEQESFAFSRFLPGFLLPGPLTYVPKTDSFVTVSSSLNLESYRFQVLAVAKDGETSDESQNMTKGKRVVADWLFSLGEAALDIFVAEFSNAPSTIFVLGERNIFAFKESGILRYMKKVDYNPSCFLPYESSKEDSIFNLVATHTKTLLVYEDMTLRWAAQVPFVPVCIQRANFIDIKGVVVILSESGDLLCCYLGTDPSLFIAPSTESREIDFEEAEQEMQELKKIIKNSSQKFPGSTRLEQELTVHIAVASQVDIVPVDENYESDEQENAPVVTVKVQIKTTTTVRDVRLMFDVQRPLVVSQKVFSFGSVSEFFQTMVSVRMEDFHIPASLKLRVLVAYINSGGAPRITESSADLPLRLVVKPCPPEKSATHKLTVDTNKPAVAINDLFPDVLGDSSTTTSNAMGFEFLGGQQVTVLASKTSQRYRLQSDSFPALWLLISELMKRLNRHFKRGSGSDVKLSYSSNIPLQEYFEVIKEHLECRYSLQKSQELLGQQAAQYRAVQKRLLTKMKDKTPTPLNNIDSLLEATHRQILSLTETAEDNLRSLEASSCSLSCSTFLVLTLFRLTIHMSDEEFSVLQAALTPNAHADCDEGWEEKTDVAVSYLLRTCLARPGKEMHASTPSLTIPKDIVKLKKHISTLVDRVNKGGHLRLEPAAKVESEDQLQGTDTEIQEEDTDTPLGSRFGERKSASGDRTQHSALKERNVNELTLAAVIENTPTNSSEDAGKAVIEGPKNEDDIDDDSFF
ncbi:protein PTHB1-like [Tachypleus tridentatus]|uniref:protein PTHB1-like n=1 Tax=Tachypleus tridentatus TaxID=6853 RepID=UPI003FD1C76D